MKFLVVVTVEGFNYDNLLFVVAQDMKSAQLAVMDTYNALGYLATEVTVSPTDKFPPLAAVINAIS